MQYFFVLTSVILRQFIDLHMTRKNPSVENYSDGTKTTSVTLGADGLNYSEVR